MSGPSITDASSTIDLGRKAMDWTVVVMFAAMPLAWIALSNSGLGNLRLAHIPALVLIVMSLPLWSALGRRIPTIVGATIFYTVSYATFSWYNGAPPFAIQQFYYIVAAFAVASILRTASQADWRILRWCGPAAVGSFLVFFEMDARRAGVDVIGLYLQAIRSGNLLIVEYLVYQPVFNARLPPSTDGNVAVLPNISHEIFAALLIAVFVSVYARTVVTNNGRGFVTLYWASITVAVVLICLSLSRSVQLVAFLACMMPLAKTLLAKVHRPATIYRALILIFVGAVLLTTPIPGFALKRITNDTASYDSRGSAITLALKAIAESPVTGTNRYAGVTRAELILHPETVGAHNFVLEAAVIGGVVTGLLALLVLLIVLRDSVRTFKRYLVDASYLAPLVGGIMAVVWSFTTGRLNQAEWMGVALLYGTTTNGRRGRAGRGELVPSSSADPVS